MCPYCGTPWCVHLPNWHPYGTYHGMHPPFPGWILAVIVAIALALAPAFLTGPSEQGARSETPDGRMAVSRMQESQPSRQNIQPERSGSDDR